MRSSGSIDGLNGGVGPLVARNGSSDVEGDEADGSARAGDDVKSRAGAQDFVDVFVDRHIAGDSGNVARHDVAGANADQSVLHSHLRVAFLRCAEEGTSR